MAKAGIAMDRDLSVVAQEIRVQTTNIKTFEFAMFDALIYLKFPDS
jgi:hypothetical protein